MSAFFEINSPNDWNKLKQKIKVDALGGQHILSMIYDVESTRAVNSLSGTNIDTLNQLKQKFIEKLGVECEPQEFLSAITTSPIVVADIQSTFLYRLLVFFNRIKFCPPPKKYRWLLGMNLASIALCKDYLYQCKMQSIDTSDFEISVIVIKNNDVTSEKIISANTLYSNMKMAAAYEDAQSTKFEVSE